MRWVPAIGWRDRQAVAVPFISAIGLILSFIALCYASPARANPAELRFAVINWSPFSMIEGNHYTGINIDLARKIAEGLDTKLVLEPCTFIRCLKEMEAGRMDMMASIAFSPERGAYMAYAPTPYDKVSVVFHVRAGEEETLKEYDDLYRLQVGYVTASFYFNPFNGDTAIRKTAVGEETQLLPMLVNGRIDAYIGTDPNAAYDIKRLGYKDRITLSTYQPAADVPVHFAFSKQSPWADRVDDLDRVIRALEENGTIEGIRSRYR